MPISRHFATDFKPDEIGYLYTLRNPNDGDIFYVGKTTGYNGRNAMRGRLTSHIGEAKRGKKCNAKKSDYIANILKEGKKPVMGLIEKHAIRTEYDQMYFDYREFFFIRSYLSYGWKLLNIIVNDCLSSEMNLKLILSSAKEKGILKPDAFYYKKDEKGFPIYDVLKINQLGYCFSEDQFASHWAYILDISKYAHIKTTTKYEYVYNDMHPEYDNY